TSNGSFEPPPRTGRACCRTWTGDAPPRSMPSRGRYCARPMPTASTSRSPGTRSPRSGPGSRQARPDDNPFTGPSLVPARMLAKRGMQGAPVRGRRVLVRVDFNVPQDVNGQVADDRRIVEALPTLNHLRAAGARTILMSHLGRPEGKRDPRLSLRPVAHRLSALLGQPVPLAGDVVSVEALELSARIENGQFLLLENLRFHPGEEANDPAFAAQLARLGEVFIEDAFGTVHRAHAST